MVCACYEPKKLEFVKFVNMSEEAAVIEPLAFKRCALSSRLFDAELEFKPFNFLQEDSPAKLYDFKEYNLCIIRAAR